MIISEIQTKYSSIVDPAQICSFDVEFVDNPTITLIHSSARFLFFKKGKGKMTINGIEYNIVPNCMIAIIPWDVTQITEVDESFEFYKIVYNFNFINGYLRTIYNPTSSNITFFNDIGNHPITVLNDKDKEKILDCFLEIHDECGHSPLEKNNDTKALSNTYIISILIRILVNFIRSNKQEYSKVSENKELTDISDIFRYIYSHLQEKITLERLSKLFFMSESTIYKHLQLNVGYTFNELVNEMRLSKSLDLLIYSDLSLQDISETVGYSDASHFIKTFLHKHGMTPKEYRKAYQNTDEIIKKKEENITFKVLEYISENFLSEKINAVSAAKHLGISLTELNYIVLFQMEKSFDDYVDWLRISRACELLITTDKAIVDIAFEVGFNSVKTFQRTFVKFRQTNPGKFRKTVALQESDGSIYVPYKLK